MEHSRHVTVEEMGHEIDNHPLIHVARSDTHLYSRSVDALVVALRKRDV